MYRLTSCCTVSAPSTVQAAGKILMSVTSLAGDTSSETATPPPNAATEAPRVDPLSTMDFFGVHKLFSVSDLFEARVHLGHRSTNVDPRMRDFVFGVLAVYITVFSRNIAVWTTAVKKKTDLIHNQGP